MVFSLVTGLADAVVGTVHELASDVDDALFGGAWFDGDERMKKQVLDDYIKLKGAGLSDDEAKEILMARYG